MENDNGVTDPTTRIKLKQLRWYWKEVVMDSVEEIRTFILCVIQLKKDRRETANSVISRV